MSLFMLGTVYQHDTGQHGDSFEWAVHEAIAAGEWSLQQYVADALARCGIRTSQPTSILFGAERARHLGYLDLISEQAGDRAHLRVPTQGRPPLLTKFLPIAASGARRASDLPSSLMALGKADLLLGCAETQAFVAATVKVNPSALEDGPGLRIGITPESPRMPHGVYMHPRKNLTVISIPRVRGFVESFYKAELMVRQVLSRRVRTPSDLQVPDADARELASWLVERREHPALDVTDDLNDLAAPAAQFVVLGRPRPADPRMTTYLHRLHEEVGVVLAPQLQLVG